LTFARAIAALAAALLLCSAAQAQPAHALRQTGGLVFHYGIVPAEIELAHSEQHPERAMHADGARRGASHLVLALFDRAGKRISQAEVQATVGPVGGPAVTRILEPMTIAGQASFGGFFSFGAPGIYRIRFEALRAAPEGTASAEFEHRVPRPEGRR
jgi:hypothetical protein